MCALAWVCLRIAALATASGYIKQSIITPDTKTGYIHTANIRESKHPPSSTVTHKVYRIYPHLLGFPAWSWFSTCGDCHNISDVGMNIIGINFKPCISSVFQDICVESHGAIHDDVIKWKHFPRNWPFVREIHRSPVNFPHKGQWRGALMFSLIYAWINDWVNNREAGDLRRHDGHYDVIVMIYFYASCHNNVSL